VTDPLGTRDKPVSDLTIPYLGYVRSGEGNMTGKPKKLVYKCFKKIGKICHFGKSDHLKV
jgi:hypothetical protein